MKMNLSVIKKRPVITGSIIIGGGLLFYFFFLRGAPEPAQQSTQMTMGYTDAQVAAASQLAGLQMQSHMQGQEIQGQLALANIAAGTELAAVEAESGTQKALAAMSLEAARYDLARDIYGMQTSVDIAAMQTQSQMAAIESNNNRDIQIQRLMTEGQVSIANMGAHVSMAGIQAQADIANNTLLATTQQIKYQNELMLGLGAMDVQRQQIQSNESIQNKRLEMDAQKYGVKKASKSADKSTIAGLATVAMLAFSDINIKSIHGCVSIDACLNAVVEMPIDFWRYLEGAELGDELHIGTYAQDFYRLLGCPDWSSRKAIHHVDMFGALGGAIKALNKTVHNNDK